MDRLGRLYTWGGSGGCMLGIPTDLAVDVSAVRHTSIRGRLQPNATKVELSTQSMGSNDASLYGGRNESVAAEAAEVAEAAAIAANSNNNR